MVFAVNLGIALVEQTRRRVLLLDILDGESGAFAKALRLAPVKANEHSLRQEDFHNPEVLHRLCVVHPSGLELMSLPRNLMEGKFLGVIYSFLNALRRHYDIVLAAIPGEPGPSGRAVLEEADKVLVAVKDSPLSGDEAVRAAVSVLVEPERLWTLKLEEGAPAPLSPDVFRMPWRATFTATRSPLPARRTPSLPRGPSTGWPAGWAGSAWAWPWGPARPWDTC